MMVRENSCLAPDFVAFGGLPLLTVFDRPKTIVKNGGKGRDVESRRGRRASRASRA